MLNEENNLKRHRDERIRKRISEVVKPMTTKSSRFVVSLALGLATIALAVAQTPAPADRKSGFAVEPLASPAGKSSSEPQMTVQGDRVILSWLEVNGERTTLKFSERNATGWSAPRSVFSSADFFVNSFDVPSVRALADGTLAAHWMDTNGDDSDASKVMLSWSKDHGQTWSRPVSPHHDGTQTEHGFVSLFQAPDAGLGLVWIDGRETNPEKETGDMSLRASVYDRNGKQLREMVVDPRVCECCSTAAATTSEGVIVAFRNRSADEIRDIYVSRFAAGVWSAPTVVHDDNWRITACPINGPAISANDKDVAVGWFTAKDDQGRAFLAFSHDGGRTFGTPIRVDDAGSQGRLGVQLLENGSAAVTWIEFANKRSTFRLRTISPTGVRSPAVTIAETSGGRYPRIARSRDELLFSWTEGEGPAAHVRTARASIGPK